MATILPNASGQMAPMSVNNQTSESVRLLSARTNAQTSAGVGGPVTPLSPGSFEKDALLAMVGPAGTVNDAYTLPVTKEDQSTYVVREGDTLAMIAELFDVNVETIRNTNNMTAKDSVKPGQTLTIPPVDGVAYKVGKGDTLSSIAAKFDIDEEEIADFNYIMDTSKVAVGTQLFIPGGKPLAVTAPKVATKTTSKASSATPASSSSSSLKGTFLRPIPGSVTSGYGTRIHPVTGKRSAHKGIDLDAYTGEPVQAAMAGTLKRTVTSGWGGGYGLYIVIDHGTYDTLYAHMSKVSVTNGQYVAEGEVIGLAGSTGQSTGPHVHFEVRKNNTPLYIDNSIFK